MPDTQSASLKRFIAGAVCPRCSSMDTLRSYSEEGKQWRDCVDCGFRDEMHFSSTPVELQTRVNLSAEDKSKQTQILTIHPLDQK